MEYVTIEIDFDVYKELTIRRPSPSVSINDVLREILWPDKAESTKKTKTKPSIDSSCASKGWLYKGVLFPNKTELRARYKGKYYYAKVENDCLVYNGKEFTSPSSAAMFITGNPVNGWSFWEYKFEGNYNWKTISYLRKNNSIRTFTEENNLLLRQEIEKNDTMETSWLEVIKKALTNLGGVAKLEDIYREIKMISKKPFTKEWKATVRRTIESHSSDSDNFNGEDVFYSVRGKGRGYWGLRYLR